MLVLKKKVHFCHWLKQQNVTCVEQVQWEFLKKNYPALLKTHQREMSEKKCVPIVKTEH